MTYFSVMLYEYLMKRHDSSIGTCSINGLINNCKALFLIYYKLCYINSYYCINNVSQIRQHLNKLNALYIFVNFLKKKNNPLNSPNYSGLALQTEVLFCNISTIQWTLIRSLCLSKMQAKP